MGYNSVVDIIGLSSFVKPWYGGCLPKARNHKKFRKNLTLQQFKVIQGHQSWCQSKAHVRLSISH